MNKDSELSFGESDPVVTDEIHYEAPADPDTANGGIAAVGPEFADGFEQEFADDSGRRKSRKRRKMFCFHCNRPEGHFLSAQHRWYYSFATGMTFGLIKIIGPYQCQCCGAKRLMCANRLNLRYWLQGPNG